MTSFVIGKVIEPEKREIIQKADKKKREIISFGILSGRTLNNFEIWDGDKLFEKVDEYADGDLVIAVVNASIGNNDKIAKMQLYLNGIGDCPEGLREQLMDLVKDDKNKK